MKYIANTNQMTDDHMIVSPGQVIPDGALSPASIERLLSSGLISAVEEEIAQAIADAKPEKDG